jgi:hypothetical protein
LPLVGFAFDMVGFAFDMVGGENFILFMVAVMDTIWGAVSTI